MDSPHAILYDTLYADIDALRLYYTAMDAAGNTDLADQADAVDDKIRELLDDVWLAMTDEEREARR